MNLPFCLGFVNLHAGVLVPYFLSTYIFFICLFGGVPPETLMGIWVHSYIFTAACRDDAAALFLAYSKGEAAFVTLRVAARENLTL